MIVVKLQGGLGNQLFQYAFGKAMSSHYKQPLYFDLRFLLDRSPRENFVFREYDLDMFNIPNIKLYTPSTNYFIKKTKHFLGFNKFSVFNENTFAFDSRVFDQQSRHLYFDGYWQSPKYFEQIYESLKTELILRVDLTFFQQELLAQIKQEESVCVNFRRTDFVTIDSAINHHGVPPLTYYYESIRKLKELRNTTKLKFYVFSDDIDWCKTNFILDEDIIYVTHDLYKGDRFSVYMQLMIACKNFIIPNSSFAWWAAWLSSNQNKIVITPKQWFVNEKIQEQTYDLRPSEWLQL